MARKQAENQTFVSLQDALINWKEVEAYYDVRLELVTTSPRVSGARLVQYLCLSAYSATGKEEAVCIASRGLEYPSVTCGSYPVALLHLLNGMAARLETRKERKTEALEQSAFFREA